MKESELPTWPEIERHALGELDEARNHVAEAGNWLRSDWQPPGSPLTSAQGRRRGEVMRIAAQMEGLIDQAVDLLLQEAGDGR